MAKLTCKDCGKTWPHSEHAGHCAACCETFMGLAAFDAHRVGEHGVDRRCELKPETWETEKGTRHGHWQDARGYWHYGRRGYWNDKETTP